MVRAVVWTLVAKTSSRPAFCEVYLLTLRCPTAEDGTIQHIRTSAVQLLQVGTDTDGCSAFPALCTRCWWLWGCLVYAESTCVVQTTTSPPHAAVVDADTDSVLLALDPEGAAEASPVPAQSTAGPAAPTGSVSQGDAKHSAAADQPVDEVDVNPRSLQQAVAALAKFTSDTVVGERCAHHLVSHLPVGSPWRSIRSIPACRHTHAQLMQ